MKESTIEEIAYEIKQAQNNNQNKPIVFLGAGASVTGNIPLAKDIAEYILNEYKDSPKIKKLSDKEKSYPRLMECLSPYDRNNLLKKYIDHAKINVTHIYLAQLMKEGYVDYVLTVNFDNLMLRALSLFNLFPNTYDMAILKDLTTTTFNEKSVIYLHGQHHGLWLLNTDEEMKKVEKVIPRILDKISDKRAWIFIGYSGEDPIFKHVLNLGRFDNGLYWVTYKDSIPNENVCRELLDRENTNSYIVKGYDADSFMLKLCNELGLAQPDILDSPFTMLSNILKDLVDINDEEHYKGVKQRLEIVKKQVQNAIQQYEDGKTNVSDKDKDENKVDLLTKQLINIIIDKKFDKDEIKALEEEVIKLKSKETDDIFADVQISWGNAIFETAGIKRDEQLYAESIEKYEKAMRLNPKDSVGYYNWANAIYEIAKIRNDESLYAESIEKYKIAIQLNPKDADTYYNWGNAIFELAKLRNDVVLYAESIEKYKNAAELNPKDSDTYYNWGNAIFEMAKIRNDEMLFSESIEKYEKATQLNPKDADGYYNWGNTIADLAKIKNDENLYLESFKKYEKAAQLNPEDPAIFINWGISISDLAMIKKDEELYKESFQKYERATQLNPDYDLAYNNWGTTISDLAKLRKDENLFKESFEKFERATRINPKYANAYDNWGNAIIELAKLKNDRSLYEESFKKLSIAFDLTGSSYNLACIYALRKNKAEALKHLEICLNKKVIPVEFVDMDTDWSNYKADADFKELLNKYREK